MKKFARRAGFVSGLAVITFSVASLAMYALIDGPDPKGFGNRAPQFSSKSPQRLAVFGDAQKGLANFSNLMAAAKREGIDLAVQTGDLVSHCDEGHYRLAIAAVRRAELGVPFLVVPGNHDLKGNPALFERRIGPGNLSATVAGVHLVILNNGLGLPDLKRAEDLLQAAPGPVLLFMHHPPFDPMKKEFTVEPGYQPFIDLIAKYPVRYVFSGHRHTYRSLAVGTTTYIVNGVGGDSDSGQFDQRAYATIVDVSADLITARPLSLDPEIGIWWNVEHLAVGHVAPVVGSWPGLAGLLLAGIGIFFLGRKSAKNS